MPHSERLRSFSRIAASITVAALAWSGLAAAPRATAESGDSPAVTLPATVTTDALPTWQVNGVVWSQVTVGNTVYVTGSFSKARPPGVPVGGAGEIDALNLFAFDITTGAPTGFSHALNAQGLVVRASADGSRIYVGGDFTTVDGIARGHLAAFDTATGALVTSFAPNIDSQVRGFAQTGGTLYVGGNFYSASGQPRNQLAAFNTANGALLGWAPDTGPTGYVWSMVLAPDASRVIVGGSFSSLNGTAASGMGSLDAQTGATLPWAATERIVTAGSAGAITSLSTDGTQIFGSGYSFGSGARFEGTFAANPTTGAINWVNDCLGDTYDTFPIGQVLYSVSHSHDCSVVGSFPDTNPRTRWQAATAAPTFPTGVTDRKDAYGWDFTGLPYAGLLHWWPSLAFGNVTSAKQAAWSITGNDTYLVLGGEFPQVNGVAQQGLVRYAQRPVAPDAMKPIFHAGFNPTPLPVGANSVQVVFTSLWDRDDEELFYDIFRNSGPKIATISAKSNFWNQPVLSYLDSGLTTGDSVRYQIRARDAKGNVQWSAWSSNVTVSAAAASAYSAAVKASSPTHYWPLDDTAATFLVDAVGGRPATNSGLSVGAPGALTGYPAVTSTASSSGRVSAPTPGSATTTVEAWVRTSSSRGGRIVGHGDSGTTTSTTNKTDRVLYLDNSGRVNFTVFDGGYKTVTSRRGVNDNSWHHIVGSVGPQGLQIFVDGVRVGRDQRSTTAASRSNGYWRIGSDTTANFANRPSDTGLSGRIDEVAVYDKALSPAEIQAHYLASDRAGSWERATDTYGAAVVADAPDLFWRLDNAGSTVPDRAGSGVVGNASGGISWSQSGAVSGSNAATFNGSTGLVVAEQGWATPGPYTAELWFKGTTNRGGKLLGFGNATSGLSSSHDRQVVMRNDGRLEYGVYTTVQNKVTTDLAYNDGGWHHLVVSLGADGMKMWVDTLLVGSDPSVASASAYTGYWRLGGDNIWGNATSRYFAGTLDEFAVYPTVLGEDAVRAHFAASGRVATTRPPVASFTHQADFLAVDFDGTGSSDPDGDLTDYAWTFGDGATSTLAEPSHTYAAAGSYQVTLTVTDSTGRTGTRTESVTVVANQPPVASFTTTTDWLEASFDASGSTDVDGTVTAWLWAFGDGATATGATSSHTYAAAGTYPVSVTVTDNNGASHTLVRDVTVSEAPNQAPVADFEVSKDHLRVSVDASDSSDPDGSVTAWAWDFGDGHTGTGETASHTYATGGTYEITLTVTDDDQASDEVTKSVTVQAANVAPTADFSHVIDGANVAFDGSGSSDPDGDVESWAWDFGDGSTGTGETASHTYQASGSYTVTLTVTDDRNGEDEVSRSVTVTVPGPRARDDFARTVSSGWGSADAGGSWTYSAGASRFSVADGVGKVQLNAGNGYTGNLAQVSTTETDLSVSVRIDKLPTGGGQYFTVIGRQVSGADYRLKVRLTATNQVTAWLMRASGATETSLATTTVSGLTNATDDTLRVRFQVSGTDATTLRAKVWKAGATEPSSWLLSTTDSTAPLQAAGSIGLNSYLSGSTTNGPVIYAWDDLLVK